MGLADTAKIGIDTIRRIEEQEGQSRPQFAAHGAHLLNIFY